MKFQEAFKIARQNPDFEKYLQRFMVWVQEDHIAGSLQFAIDDEAFYYSGEACYNTETGKYEFSFRGGKHTAHRATQIINSHSCFIIR